MYMYSYSKPIKGTVPGTAITIFADYVRYKWVGNLRSIWFKLFGWKLDSIDKNMKYFWD